MHRIRKFGLILLFFWFTLALLADLFGTKLFFPFSTEIGGQEDSKPDRGMQVGMQRYVGW